MKISFSGFFWGLICMGIALFFLYGSWGAYTEYKRVQDYGGWAIGHITKKHIQKTADDGGNYYIDYWFISSSGSKISASCVIAQPQWDLLRISDTMEVRYDQSNPNRNIPMHGGSPSLVFAFFMLAMGSVFMIFGASRFLHSLPKRKTIT